MVLIHTLDEELGLSAGNDSLQLAQARKSQLVIPLWKVFILDSSAKAMHLELLRTHNNIIIPAYSDLTCEHNILFMTILRADTIPGFSAEPL